MPSTINGVGTGYAGKSNYSRRQGICQFCKRQAVLEDYDTRLFFVVLFIPIIPLKRLHVMNKCSRCTKHQVVNGANWDQLQSKADAAVEAANRSPRDEKLAIEVLGACVSLRDVARLEKIAPEYETRFATNPRMLSFVAEAYDSFGKTPDAERVLRAAVAKSDEPEPHEALGRILSRTNRPAEAQAHLQHIIDDVVPDRVDDIYQLAQSYQRVGQHREAIAMFDACRQIFPKVEENATYRKFRAASESLINTTKPVDGVKMIQGERTRATGKKLLKVGLAVALLVVGGYAAWALIAGYRTEVFLVNGLDREYRAIINGTPHSLSPHSMTSIRLPMGTEHIEVPDLAGVAPTDVTIQEPFLSRPFNSDVFVINPDRGAVIVKSEIPYAKKGNNVRRGRNWLTCGQQFVRFSAIDYPFSTPPAEVDLPSPSAVVTKIELQLLQDKQDLPAAALVAALQQQGPAGDVAQFVEAQASFDTNAKEYVQQLPEAVPPEQLSEFLRARLPSHADSVEWNRLYVHTMSRLGHEQDVSKEYDAKLEQDPANRLNQFLAAVATHDPARYLDLMKKAAVEPGAIPDAHSRLCGYLGSIGENHLAAQEADAAMQKMASDPETRYFAVAAYIADHQFDKALKLTQEDQALPMPRSTLAVRQTAWLLHAVGRGADADAQVHVLQNQMREYDPQQQQTAIAEFNGNVAYQNGDAATFISRLRLSSDPDDRFVADLTSGNIRSANDELAQIEAAGSGSQLGEDSQISYCMLYIAAVKSEPEIARRMFDKIVRLLKAGDFEDRAYASAMEGKTEPTDAVLTHLRDSAARRRIILTTIGLASPTRTAACFEMVRKINGDPSFPKLLIEKAIAN